MRKEIWKQIPGFKKYEISSKKRIRLIKKKFLIFNSYPKKIKSFRNNYVILKSDGFSKTGFYIIKKIDILFDKAFNS
tara:strand:- start:4464 stop:4694 length:231 start_codon:yes stop_codon:yes gene_type:complete